MVESGQAEALVVAKLDRLPRSLIDFAVTLEQARAGWELIPLDLGVDPSTPSGEMMANVMASFAQYERRLISDRTKAALAALECPGSSEAQGPHRCDCSSLAAAHPGAGKPSLV